MNVIEWASSVKADLVELQGKTGIPALWAAAQMCHESAVDGGDGLSELARQAHNYAGLKWARWQEPFGCSPVTYGTWEVLDGQRVNLDDAFCSSPTWPVWLQVYGDLLTGSFYGPALRYASDPLLYGLQVWKAGWATDPHYLVGVGGWMAQLHDIYRDTLQAPAMDSSAARQSVPIKDHSGRLLCSGWIEEDKTVVRVRDLAEALNLPVSWNQDEKSVILGN